MPTAKSLLEKTGKYKSDDIAVLPPNSTVLEAAKLMNERHIGSVLVLADNGLVGIFTERDILVRVVAEQKDPSKTHLAEVMTSPVACASPHTTLDELRKVMREKRIRHIPIDEDGKPVGLLSIGDLNQAEHAVQEQTIHYLKEFLSRP